MFGDTLEHIEKLLESLRPIPEYVSRRQPGYDVDRKFLRESQGFAEIVNTSWCLRGSGGQTFGPPDAIWRRHPQHRRFGRAEQIVEKRHKVADVPRQRGRGYTAEVRTASAASHVRAILPKRPATVVAFGDQETPMLCADPERP